MKTTLTLFACMAICQPTIASAQGGQTAIENASGKWTDCLVAQVTIGARSSDDNKTVVDRAFVRCAVAEQQLSEALVADRLAKSKGHEPKQTAVAAVANHLRAVKVQHYPEFVAGVEQTRQQYARTRAANSPYGDPELDNMMAKSAATLSQINSEKIKIYKQSCSNRDEYLALLSVATDRDRQVLIETCATYKRNKTNQPKR